MSHAVTRLLADLADTTTLIGELSEAADGLRGPRPKLVIFDAANEVLTLQDERLNDFDTIARFDTLLLQAAGRSVHAERPASGGSSRFRRCSSASRKRSSRSRRRSSLSARRSSLRSLRSRAASRAATR